MSSPCHQAGLGKRFEVPGERILSVGLGRIGRHDFEIPLSAEREESVLGTSARMNAAKCRAYSGACFNEGNAAVQVATSEDEVIEHCRSAGGVRPEATRGQHCAGGSAERGIDEPSSTPLHRSTAPVGVLALAGWLPLHPRPLDLMWAEGECAEELL
jgi:hypothetical protein